VRQLQASVGQTEGGLREKEEQVRRCEAYIDGMEAKLSAHQDYIQTLEASLQEEMSRHAPMYGAGLENLSLPELQTLARIHDEGLRQVRLMQQQRQQQQQQDGLGGVAALDIPAPANPGPGVTPPAAGPEGGGGACPPAWGLRPWPRVCRGSLLHWAPSLGLLAPRPAWARLAWEWACAPCWPTGWQRQGSRAQLPLLLRLARGVQPMAGWAPGPLGVNCWRWRELVVVSCALSSANACGPNASAF